MVGVGVTMCVTVINVSQEFQEVCGEGYDETKTKVRRELSNYLRIRNEGSLHEHEGQFCRVDFTEVKGFRDLSTKQKRRIKPQSNPRGDK